MNPKRSSRLPRTAGVLALAALMLAACAAEQPETTEEHRRTVVVTVLQPKPMNVSIALPVVVYPFREIEIRAAANGRIISLPFEEGDLIEQSSIPAATWLEEDTFREITNPPTDEKIELRNLRHLEGFACFARIDSSQLVQTMREQQANYDQAVRDLRRLQGYPETTGSQLDNARTRRSMARAGAERTLAMIHDTYVCSPVSGVLVELLRHEGEFVSAGELLGRVAVLDPLIAELELPEAHHRVLKAGDIIEVRFDSIRDDDGEPLTHEGRVRRVDRVAHPQTHTFTVEIQLENPELDIPAGIFGRVDVSVYSNPEALVVPMSSLKLDGDVRSIFVVGEEGRVTEYREIHIGRMTGGNVELRDTRVKEGMKVVTIGAQWLEHGDMVRWTETDPVEN